MLDQSRRARERRRKPRPARQARQHDLPDRDRQRRSSRRVARGQHHRDHARPVHHAELFVRAARLARRLGEALVAETAARLHRHLRAGEEEAAAHRGRPAPVHVEPALLQGRARGRAPARRPHEPALRARHRPLSASRSARPPASALCRGGGPAAFRCSACTPPAPTGGSIAACSTIRASPKNYRVIVFDMPWHGKSSPPVGWENEEYQPHLARLCAHDPAKSPPRSSSTSRS